MFEVTQSGYVICQLIFSPFQAMNKTF